jgi:DNA-binding response OmpR family regulator
MTKALIVEDEPAISNLIKKNMIAAGYQCTQVGNGMEAATLIMKNTYDIILLDIMLPGLDGYELMDYIRETKVPTIFITAKNSTEDKVKGLKLGADDFLVKPFDIVELLARVEVVLRRYKKLERIIVIEDVEIDTVAHTVHKKGHLLDLTPKEYDLLLLLVHNKHTALFRDKILEIVWGFEYAGETRTVDIHIQRLRKKLDWEDKIVTVFKIGYRLEV